MKWYREWAPQPNQRRGCMLPLERFADILRSPDPGYASVYAFAEEHAQEIIAAHSSSGLDKYPVRSEMLMIDLDDGERQLRRAEAALEGIEYFVWASGGKGFHLGLPLLRPMCGLHVPYSQRKWVESRDIGADLSLYQHGRILSLVGRVHPKTGKRKELIRHVLGEEFPDIPILVPPLPTFAIAEGDQTELEQGLWQVLALLANEPGPGNRHTKLWSTAKSLADAGLSYDTALDLLTQVNDSWTHPKVSDELVAAVQQAFRR